jgi:hypothetical protein
MPRGIKGFQPGHERSGGRQKGTPNKKRSLEEVCEEKGIDPFAALLEMAQDQSDKHLRFQALKEVCQYLYPKRKTLEHSGEINTNPYADYSLEELEEMVKNGRS